MKEMCFSKKILIFLKITKGSKVAVECDWNSKISQNVHILVFFFKNERDVFFEKNLDFFRNH